MVCVVCGKKFKNKDNSSFNKCMACFVKKQAEKREYVAAWFKQFPTGKRPKYKTIITSKKGEPLMFATVWEGTPGYKTAKFVLP